MLIDDRIAELGLILPQPPVMPTGVRIAFDWVRIVDDRAYVSGHGALAPDGTPTGPYGKVPSGVTLEQAQESARLACLAILSSLRAALGSLERVRAWATVTGFVNAEPGYAATTAVLNPVSDVLIAVFGDAGRHARTAIGAQALPLDLPVVVAGEVILHPPQ